MTNTRTACLLLLLTLLAGQSSAQSFSRSYEPLKSGSKIQDKDFYLFTLMEAPACRTALEKDTLLAARQAHFQGIVASMDTLGRLMETIGELVWSPEDIAAVGGELQTILFNYPDAGHFLIRNMRASGYWIRYENDSDSVLLRKAWEDAAHWENRIIQNYTTNKGFRYPAIDSGSFAPKGPEGQDMLLETSMMVWHHKDRYRLFFQPGLEMALGILFVNDRDEAARFEPLDSSNRSAYKRIPTIHWSDYMYSVILLPGEGPENNQPMSAVGKYRCQLGAELYKQHLAPFIIVSGGFVHPIQTPYCEAAEMKAYLVGTLGIPEDAVILEPHARHTTTNIRNANRILFRKGIPTDKRVLCTSTSGQLAYIITPFFAMRCKNEMGYVPYKDMKPVDPFNASYLPDMQSLQMDAIDPLDP